MKTSSGNFCVVCREQLIRRILHHVDLVEAGQFTVTPAGPGQWLLDVPLSSPDVDASWTVDGETVAAGPYGPHTLDTAKLTSGEHSVTLSVKPAGDLVRIWTDEVVEALSVTVKVP